MKTIRTYAMLGILILVLVVGGAALPSRAADHLEAPLVQLDGRIDINDIYAFQSPTNPDNTVLIMTVNPLAGVLSPTTFSEDADYEFIIDNDDDDKKEIKIEIRFDEPNSSGVQEVEIDQDGGRNKSEGEGDTGEIIDLDNGGMAYVGTFDDPFFFDFLAFLGTVKGEGTRTFCDGNEADFFAGANVSAIVLEVPSNSLTDDSSIINIWAEIEIDDDDLDPEQDFGEVQERMGKPAIATVLIPDGAEDPFNDDAPRDDVRLYSAAVTNALLTLSGLDGSGYTPEEAATITGLLLPDVLTLDTTSSDGFVPGLNGRQLPEDVIDFELFVVTGGLFGGTPVLDSDCVDANDVPFPGTFPYLAPAHP